MGSIWLFFYSGHNLWVKLYFPPSYTTAKSNSFTQLNSLIHNMNILWFRLDFVSNTIHDDKSIEHKSISFQQWKKIIYSMKFNSEFRTTFWFPALSCLLSKEAIWKWQVARWRRGSDDDKYLMRSSLNNSSRLEWIIEMMAMNHEEGPDLISLYRNSRDYYSCTQPLWKTKTLDMFFIIFRQRKSYLTICTARTHQAYV